MIITQENSKRVVESHDFDSVNCTIDAEDMRYVASLLRNNYSKPVLAVIREIVANGLDANSEANASRKVEVTVPSTLNPHFVVRDFGGGLSPEDIFGLYSKYGKSTKRSSNNYIGAFGIGKFAPLCYGDNFTCVSFHGGIKTSYNIFVNEDDDTKIVKLDQVPSSEPTGLSVEVAVADSDINTFRDEVKKFFKFFSKEDMPKFIGIAEDDEEFFEELKFAMVAEDDSWFMLDDGNNNNTYYSRAYSGNNHYGSHAMMGRVHYPIDPDAINFDSLSDDDNDARSLKDLVEQDNLYIRFDIGQLKLHHSRESLEYNKPTQKEIIAVLKKVRSEIEEIAKEKLGNAEDLWDAKVKYAQVVNNLPHTLRNVFRDSFEWNGVKISNTAIERPYQYADSILITQCDKTEDADATDGFRVKSQKVTRILPQENARLVIQDLASSHGNALRVRTLFNEDDDCKVVYIVNATEDDAENHLFDVDGMGFVSISKSRIKYTSNIAKAKLQAKGRAVSGESRASVPLFELDIEGINRRKHRNADYWLNCNEKIDDLEQGSRELVYVPIASYKVVNELTSGKESTTELGALLRDVQGIRNIQKELHKGDDEFEFPLVVGVRRADCKKLTKPRWVSWSDYKRDFCKSYLVKNLTKVKESEKAMAYKQFNNHEDLKFYKRIENVMQNKGFTDLLAGVGEMSASHLVVDVANDLSVMQEDNAELTTIFRMVNFLKGDDSEWVEKNIPNGYKISEFDSKCEDICEKYPLLESISNEVYGWLDMESHKMGINLVKFIKMTDLMSENDLVV